MLWESFIFEYLQDMTGSTFFSEPKINIETNHNTQYSYDSDDLDTDTECMSLANALKCDEDISNYYVELLKCDEDLSDYEEYIKKTTSKRKKSSNRKGK